MKINCINPQINFKRVIKIDEPKTNRQNNELCSEEEMDFLQVLNDEKSCYFNSERSKITAFFRKYRDKKNTKATIEEYNGSRYLITDKEAEDIIALKEYAKNVNNFPTLKIPTFYADDVKYKQELFPFQKTTSYFVKERCEKIISESLHKNPITSIRFEEIDNKFPRITKFTITEETDNSTTSKTLDLKA